MSLSSIGFGAQPTSAWDDLQAWRSQQQDLSQLYSDADSSITNALSGALTDQTDGLVNLAADAAAARLGVSLPGSTAAADTSNSPKTNTSSTNATPPAGAPSVAFTSIDQFLATLDGNGHLSAPATSSATSAPFNFNSYMANLDQIASGEKPAKPSSPNGQFNLNSYLANLDLIAATTPVTPVVDVSA